ncbi:16998_t:CDS:2 [Cetraspora pellucida]|uniref:16998_t:CDS:1 n=1 Tax=Cetraspora pellucida TaxID=1433469 RepID=A0A9N9KCV9_9GLOM|nr:16998_t:CDS:2 [Cetraspora pellucida]
MKIESMREELDQKKEKIREETEKETEKETKEKTEKEADNSINRPNITKIINLVKNTLYDALCNYFDSLPNSVLLANEELLNNSYKSNNKNRYHLKGCKVKTNNNFKLHLFEEEEKIINKDEIDFYLDRF